ncbi:MAG: bifunctional diaminohydroxyphosphoribosylaminopyrimidine deaminase/5-amino-6-(5-phosphoribosylamino)uracil reductase RibD [Rubrivivax sp.]
MPLTLTALDQDRLEQAHGLAEAAIGLSDPNPRVGCVIGFDDGRIIGSGHTQLVGGPHAEVMALRDAAQAGNDIRGATAWVTLEPCCHHGRTPPCCDALIQAGVARVVAAAADPFAAVAGKGLQRLHEAGIQVDLGDDHHAQQTRELNIGYFSRIERGRPWVRVKAAITLDGRTALLDGRSQWITGAAARHDGHAWRRRASAILSGIGTVLADNPRLDVRGIATTVQPLRVVLDSRLRLPLDAKLLAPPGRVLVATSSVDRHRQRELQSAGAEIWLSTGPPPDAEAGPAAPGEPPGCAVPLAELLRELASRQVNELHVEAGATLNGALANAQLVDEWLLYQAPLLLGSGRGLLDSVESANLADAMHLRLMDSVMLGDDRRLRLRPAERRDS